MALGLIDKGISYTEEDFKTQNERKTEMYEALERLKNVWEKKTAVELPEVKTYDKKEYIESDENAIKKQVQNQYEEQIDAGKEKIQTDYNEKKANLDKKIDEENQDFMLDSQEIAKKYDQKKGKALSNAIDQGIARSSINATMQESLDKEYSEEIKNRKSQSELLGKAYNMELAVLESKLENALSSFEIEQAVKIQNKIDDLIKSAKKENEKILEYNNKMTELEQKSILAREEAKKKADEKAKILEEEERLMGYTGEKKNNYDSRFNIARKYYMSLPKEQALEELATDGRMPEYLGLYYTKLRTLLQNR